MRVTNLTITCDICGANIDPNTLNAIALLDIKKMMSKLNTFQRPSNGMLKELPQLRTEQELVNIQVDICEDCLKKVENYIETIKIN